MEATPGCLLSFSFAKMAAVSGHRLAISRSSDLEVVLLVGFGGLLLELMVAVVLITATL